MLLLAFFKTETVVGRLFKTSVCGLAAIVLYLGLTAQPSSSVLIAVSLSVLAMLFVHGVVHTRRVSPTSAVCVADILESERRIRVVGGGIELMLNLPTRTLTVRHMPKHFISADAPGEFHRLRAGRFGWPFHWRAGAYDAGPTGPDKAIALHEPANAMRWGGKAGAQRVHAFYGRRQVRRASGWTAQPASSSGPMAPSGPWRALAIHDGRSRIEI
jgi:hypothetical protein